MKRLILSERYEVARSKKAILGFSCAVFLAVNPLVTRNDSLTVCREYDSTQMKRFFHHPGRPIRASNQPMPDFRLASTHKEVLPAHNLTEKIAKGVYNIHYLTRIGPENINKLLELMGLK